MHLHETEPVQNAECTYHTETQLGCFNQRVVTLGAWPILVPEANCIKQDFLLVSSSCLYSRMRKGGGNKEEKTRKLVLLYEQLQSTKVNHATKVTTLWSKQLICFYSELYIVS